VSQQPAIEWAGTLIHQAWMMINGLENRVDPLQGAEPLLEDDDLCV
jgi:hypothetical protein